MKRIYVGHATLFLFDRDEPEQESEWTLRHCDQNFCRRQSTAQVHALMEEDGYVVELLSSRAPPSAAVVELSMLLTSGQLLLSGGDPGGIVVWEGKPGWARVHLGQTVVEPGERPKLALHLHVEPDGEERPTRVYGDWGRPIPAGPYLETAEVLRLPEA